MQPLTTFDISGQTVNLYGCTYRVGRADGFVLATDMGVPYGTVSVNLPGYPLAADEVLVKTWDENAPAREPLLKSSFFCDTGKRVACGSSFAEVWKILPTRH